MRKIQPGSPGYFEAASALQLLEVPSSVDRSLGDIHPLGNPHAHLDPHNIAKVATGAHCPPGSARCAECGVLTRLAARTFNLAGAKRLRGGSRRPRH